MLFPGESDAIQNLLDIAAVYGYGNCIAHLKRAWAEHLVMEWGFPEDLALQHANTDAYALRLPPTPLPGEDDTHPASKDNSIRVLLTGDHPHAGETGTVDVANGKVRVLRHHDGGPDQFLVTLDACAHGIQACYATHAQARLLDAPTESRPRIGPHRTAKG